ncbi:hypothetical protein [Dictyobacter arantiisoli]|uniref:Uncharacterized protein n=1 Tax=Dictyobacter arantiisoli TaxID=2014874 RepID=A0A5A5TGQ0_9CHLR|nr:hypothetical protein [Dictyobacter arantiisoli]GCF10537.1 hypothetical protein KDI_41010 [Dictyobacter arantiisoli]
MMQEHKPKQTLEQIRNRYPFDLTALALRAGIGTRILYHALLHKPITLGDAEKLVVALSHHTGLPLSLDLIDLVTWEDYLCLWIIRASITDEEGHVRDTYQLVYARNQEHAAITAHFWLIQHAQATHIQFTPCPEGLHLDDMAIPGIPPCKQEKERLS